MTPHHIFSREELRTIATPRTAVGCSERDEPTGYVLGPQLLDTIISTALDDAVTDKHLTAACNALCFVARQMSACDDGLVKAHVFSIQTWHNIIHVINKAFHDGKNKPALQVLDSLPLLAQSNPDVTSVRSCIATTVSDMLRTVFCRDRAMDTKQACIMLYFFLRKLSDFMAFPELLDRTFLAYRPNLVRRCGILVDRMISAETDQIAPWCGFVVALISAVGYPDSKSAALKLLALIYTSASDLEGTSVQPVVIQVVQFYSSSSLDAQFDVVRIVLPAILDSPGQLEKLLEQQPRDLFISSDRLLVVLTALEVARERNFIQEDDVPRLMCSSLPILNNTNDPFDNLLAHRDPAVRVKSFNLLTMSNSPIIPIPKRTMDCLLRSLPALFNDTDAYLRSEIISVMKRLCARLKQSKAAAVKKGLRELPSTTDPSYPAQCDLFANDLLNFLGNEIFVQHTYARHILALHSLLILHDSLIDMSQAVYLRSIQKSQLVDKLVVLVLDAYDDVREMAMQLLRRILQTSSQTLLADPDLCAVARLTANTNRADHADAYGRLLLLASTRPNAKLDSKTNSATPGPTLSLLLAKVKDFLDHRDSFNVHDKFPLHGSILGIAYCLPYAELGTNSECSDTRMALQIASKIWTMVQPHLCVDSPEMEVEDDEDDLTGPKDILAYAWRALRDSNVMMQAMLRSTPVTDNTCKVIGGLIFEQLCLLRHRGAFSSVAQTFVLCCNKLRERNLTDSQRILEHWFNQAILQIDAQAHRLTRRSAGLPSIFAAILDPKSVTAFSKHFKRLIALASVDTDGNSSGLPEVHALNCLKDIMTNSRFRLVTESFLLSMVNLAGQRISSEVWAVKNCGLMLFRACINRIDTSYVYGDRAQKSVPENQNDNAEAVTIALGLLEKHQPLGVSRGTEIDSGAGIANQRSNNEAIFASIDLMSRIYIKRNDRNRAVSAIIAQLSHEVWHVRAQAAKLLAQMALPGEELAWVEKMLCPSSPYISYNQAHGACLGAQALLRKVLDVPVTEESRAHIFRMLSQSMQGLTVNFTLPIAATVLEMANMLLSLDSTTSSEIEVFTVHVRALLSTLNVHSRQPCAAFRLARALFDTNLSVYAPKVVTLGSTCTVLKDQDSDVAEYVLNYIASLSDPPRVSRVILLVVESLRPFLSATPSAAALSTFASLLPRCEGAIDANHAEFMACALDFKADTDRDLLLAQIRVYASLLVYSSSHCLSEAIRILKKYSSTFVRLLRFAAADQIELPTRESALTALTSLVPVLATEATGTTHFDPALRCELLLTLHDFLSDDDEDIRVQAAKAVPELLDKYKTKLSSLIPQCAYVERTRLRSFILSSCSARSVLYPEMLVRLFGIQNAFDYQSSAQALSEHCRRHTVEKDLKDIVLRAKDLFAEEKQNLYIDETAEVSAWSDSLDSFHGDINDYIAEVLRKWCSSGLSLVANLLEEDIEYRHEQHMGTEGLASRGREYALLYEQTLFSVTNYPEVLLLVLRVIAVAKLLLKRSLDITVKSGLEGLEATCLRTNVHQEVQAALRK